MIPFPSKPRIFLRPGRTDGRQGINGLAALVQAVIKEFPFSGNLFLFLNKRGSTLKMLYWDRNGFCLWMKRLEEDRFYWPKGLEEKSEISERELQWLLDGLDIAKLKPHTQKSYTTVL